MPQAAGLARDEAAPAARPGGRSGGLADPAKVLRCRPCGNEGTGLEAVPIREDRDDGRTTGRHGDGRWDGIGKAVALGLAGAGYAVVLAGRRREPLEGTAAKAGGAETLVVTGDVGDPAAVRGLFDEVKSAFGRLDLLFNNAGIGAPPVPLEDLTFDQWRGGRHQPHRPFLCTRRRSG